MLGSFSVTKMLGNFFLPNCWVEPVSDKTTQLLSQIAGFLRPPPERAVLSEDDLVYFFSETGLYSFHLISKVFTVL